MIAMRELDALTIIAIQIYYKTQLSRLIRDWGTNPNSYRKFIKVLAQAISHHFPRFKDLMDEAITAVDKCQSIDCMIKVCSQVFEESGGILDICP
ncbi:MAG: hypothetical protein DRO14_03245 [Thermoprotei archaeon]|nr:MAG: hypothetical protein DRO14_03245 [Thermoprotei archaeon]